MGARRRCCCECYTFRDDFDRADSTDLGTDWQECTGDWQIVGEQLVGYGAGIVALKHMAGNQVGTLEIYLTDLVAGAIVSIRAFYGTQACPCTSKVSWKLGRAVNMERLLGEILGGVAHFPAHLSMHDQGRFALGYYHQRQAFFTKPEVPTDAPAPAATQQEQAQ